MVNVPTQRWARKPTQDAIWTHILVLTCVFVFLGLVLVLPLVALVFTILTIVLLSIRIREENKALRGLRDPA